MTTGRPAIPAALKRSVEVEAGHRCAIPTCRTVPIEIAHIVPWSKVREHRFENLIALCPTCHTRYDQGDIDRPAMRQYKANLSVVANRYGDLERRVLHMFAHGEDAQVIQLGPDSNIHMMYLVEDGLFNDVTPRGGVFIGSVRATRQYSITPAGREFVSRWVAAQPLEPESD